jgi:hypothetical protein
MALMLTCTNFASRSFSGLNLIGGNRLVLFDPDW